MLKSNAMRTRGDMHTERERKRIVSGLIRIAASQVAIVGWLAMTLPSTAASIPTSYRNTFRGCSGRLVSVGISSQDAATACAGALRPTEVSRCVVQIKQQTAIAAEDALSTCRQDRRPNEVAKCVVGISRNSEEIAGVLDYCGRRSLLPVRFAECVVGLRREIEISPTQAMDSCIDEGEEISEFAPNFVPANQTPVKPAPATPSVSGDPTPLAPSTPAPIAPQNQTPSVQPTPAPTAPANPGRV